MHGRKMAHWVGAGPPTDSRAGPACPARFGSAERGGLPARGAGSGVSGGRPAGPARARRGRGITRAPDRGGPPRRISGLPCRKGSVPSPPLRVRITDPCRPRRRDQDPCQYRQAAMDRCAVTVDPAAAVAPRDGPWLLPSGDPRAAAEALPGGGVGGV